MFEAVVRWVKHDTDIREEHLADLVAKVRLPLLTPQYLADRVAQEELIKTSLKCRYTSSAGTPLSSAGAHLLGACLTFVPMPK